MAARLSNVTAILLLLSSSLSFYNFRDKIANTTGRRKDIDISQGDTLSSVTTRRLSPSIHYGNQLLPLVLA
jgi:hypothetical protein